MNKLTLTLTTLLAAAHLGYSQSLSTQPTAVPKSIEPEPIIFPAAAGNYLVDVDTNDVALGGFDPVAMQSEGKLVKGSPDNQFKHNGATYLFATPSNRQVFESDSAKYAPMFGGFCAVSASFGRVEKGDPHFWTLHDGHLVVSKNEKAAMMFKKNPDMFFKKAEDNWPKLLQELGKQ